MMINKIRRKIAREGFKHTLRDIHNRSHIGRYDYGTYISPEEMARQRTVSFAQNPLISIVVPLFNTDDTQLRDMIDSVLEQTYPNYELCMIDYSDSPMSNTEKIVNDYIKKSTKIRYEKGVNKGIADNTNECIDISNGEYIAILDHDDMLHPSALFEVVEEINNGADFIYTDEVKFREKGLLERPNFKPDFSTEELLMHNFICHFNVYSRRLYELAGGYDDKYDGSQDHEMVLRLTSVAKKIVHIKKVLYFWRIHAGSVAGGIGAKPYATMAGIRGIDNYLKNNDIDLHVESIHDNVPIYKYINTEINGSITIIIWGSKSEEYKRDIAESIKKLINRDAEVVYWDTNTINDELENKILCCESDYLLLMSDGINIDSADNIRNIDINELLIYSRYNDIKASDCRIVSGNRLFSGGVYLKDGQPRFRSTGMPKIYQGYEADFHHARMVSGVSGIFSVFYLNNIKNGADRCMWTPFTEVDIEGSEKELSDLKYMDNEVLLVHNSLLPECFYSANIEKYKLD